jgi:hypothetical protein
MPVDSIPRLVVLQAGKVYSLVIWERHGTPMPSSGSGATADYNSVNPSTERAYEKSPLLRGKLIYLDGLEYFTT